MNYLILALATYRLSSLLANEEGPFGIFERFRFNAGVARDENGQQYGLNAFATGLICIWCNSVWVGLAMTIAYAVTPLVTWLCLPLALSSVAILLDRFTLR